MRDGAKSKKLGPFLRQNWMPVGLLVGSLAVAMWFGVQVFLDGLYFNDPNNVDVDLKPWMTPRFIVITYDLPKPFVFDLLALDSDTERGIRLGTLAAERDMTMEELTAQVRQAAATFREDQP